MVGAVGALVDRNRQRGHAQWCDRDYDFVCPSNGTYPFQWFWDSCFHAIALSHVDVARAEAVAAVAARGRGDDFVTEVVDGVRRFIDWCHLARDPDGDGLIAVLQPDETGLDHSPKFDAYLGIRGDEHGELTAAWHRVADPYDAVGRDLDAMFASDGFIVEDVMVNTIYAENQRVLADLLDRTGDAAGAAVYRERADRTTAALLERCWDPRRGVFVDLAGLDEHWLTTDTVSGLFPLLLADLDAAIAERLVAHLRDPARYAVAFPVPSVARNEPSYRPGTVGGTLTWRGPTWINASWYLVRGLLRHGYDDLALHIIDRTAALVESAGFREHYNPETGEGHGAVDFGWSALVLDMLALAEAHTT